MVCPDMTAAELCKLLIIDKATASGILERMVDTGWIVKKQDPADGRVQHLYPSEKADQHKERLIEERKKANKNILKKFSSMITTPPTPMSILKT